MERALAFLSLESRSNFWRDLAKQGLDLSTVEQLQGGRSNSVFRLGQSVLKVYDPSGANPLFSNDPNREIAVLENLSDTDLAPRLRDAGTTQGLRWILYDHIAGKPWESGTSDVAALLARIHDETAPDGLERGPNGSVELARQTQKILQICPDQEALTSLEPTNMVRSSSDLALLHGDPVPGNILVSERQMQLIDWQCPVIGDPAEDLALFLSPAMQFLYRGVVLTHAEEARFLASYPHSNRVARYLDLQPWYHWRMAAYCLWRSQRGDARDNHAMGLEIQKLKSLRA